MFINWETKNFRRVQPTRCKVSQYIYFSKTLYMFQTGFPSTIRSSKLHIQLQVFVRPILLDCVWNVMAHAQKPDFVFRRNWQVHLNRWEASVQSTTGSRGVNINGSNAGYTMFRGSVNSTGYPLHSPVSPSLPVKYVTVCHHILTGLYLLLARPG